MCMSGGGGGDGGAAAEANALAREQRARELAREERIKTGMTQIDTAFQPFNEEFYQGRAKAYTDYAAPQLEDQYAKAKRELVYALGRNGILDSSEAARQSGELTKQYGVNQQALVDTGQTYANDARTKVEANRSDLVSQLNASGEPDSVASATSARLTNLQALPGFSPLAQMFASAAQYAGAVQPYASAYNTFGPSNGGATVYNPSRSTMRTVN